MADIRYCILKFITLFQAWACALNISLSMILIGEIIAQNINI